MFFLRKTASITSMALTIAWSSFGMEEARDKAMEKANNLLALVRDNTNYVATNKKLAAGPDGNYLVNANLSEIDLTGVDFTGANLQGARLHSAILKNANLTDANLSKAILYLSSLEGAVFTNADVSGADLRFLESRAIDLQFLATQGAKWDPQHPPLVGDWGL